jgi:hypothetical protein
MAGNRPDEEASAMKKILLTAVAVSTFVLLPTAAGAVPMTGGAGAAYGEHISEHARAEGGFSGVLNPGDHHGFAGFDEHH